MKLYPYRTLVLKFCCVALLLVVCNRKKIPGSIAQKGATQKDAKIKHLAARQTVPHHTPDPERRNNNEHQIIQQEQKEQEDKQTVPNAPEGQHKDLKQARESIEAISAYMRELDKKKLKEIMRLNSWEQLRTFRKKKMVGYKREKTAKEKTEFVRNLRQAIQGPADFLKENSIEEFIMVFRSENSSYQGIIMYIATSVQNEGEKGVSVKAILEGLDYALEETDQVPPKESYDALKEVVKLLL